MISEAIAALGSPTTNVAVRDWILQRYPGTNPLTIQAQIVACTVNHASRVHYPENKKPRFATSQHDFLYRPERGRLETYDPQRHGRWEIVEEEDGRLVVHPLDENAAVVDTPTGNKELQASDGGSAFAAEAHLRDYLAGNLGLIEGGLELFVDEAGTTGVEYHTPIGNIDILAVDAQGGFVVIELKVSRGPDSVAGQVLRYKNWVKRHLAEGKSTRGIIIAQHISEKVLYSLLSDDDVSVKEYEIALTIKDAPVLS